MDDPVVQTTTSTSYTFSPTAVPPIHVDPTLPHDNSNPYFLHHSDNLGLSLVSQPLTRENYVTWSRAMRIALSAKNKLAFVDGSILPPSEDYPLFPSWQRCNEMVLSWLLNSISPKLSSNVIYATYAFQVWNDLAERLRRSNGLRIYHLQGSIASIQQLQSSIADYFNELKEFWDELATLLPIPPCQCTTSTVLQDYQETQQVYQFLMGLNESYSANGGQILLMRPLPSVNKVYSLLLQEEAHREVSTPDSLNSSQPAAFAARNTSASLLPTPPTTNLRSSRPREHDGKRPSVPRPPRRSIQCTHATSWDIRWTNATHCMVILPAINFTSTLLQILPLYLLMAPSLLHHLRPSPTSNTTN